MHGDLLLTRRSALAAAAATASLIGRPGFGFAQEATPQASPVPLSPVPLWETAWERAVVD